MAKRKKSTTPMRPCSICGKPVAGDRGERIHQTRGDGRYCRQAEEPKESKAKETDNYPSATSQFQSAADYISACGGLDMAVLTLDEIRINRSAFKQLAKLL